MPEPVAPSLTTIVILLVAAVFLLGSLLVLGLFMARCLARIERRLGGEADRQDAAAAPPATEVEPGGPFETFLNEDPARRALPRREQFAAYRRWRQERGMNWSKS